MVNCEVFVLLVGFVLCSSIASSEPRNAIVTLVTGYHSGYAYGAVALGESLKVVGSKLKRVVMVTPEVDTDERSLLSLHWDIVEVDPIPCVHRSALQPGIPDINQYPEGLQQDMKRWGNTCTKFSAWKLVEYDRIIFMDSDTIVLEPIDDVLYLYSNASLAASPECFPPDTFNSGFMVLTPSIDTFEYIVDRGIRMGSAEGGDQGILNNYYCPEWFTANSDNEKCGRLPWMYNVEAQYYLMYKNYRALYGMDKIKVIHFINDGKPWKTLFYDLNYDSMTMTSMIKSLSEDLYVAAHLYWRYCFLRATGMRPPSKSIYYSQWSDVTNRRGIYSAIDEKLFDS
mmetsp:Transcript_26246/g.38902  ORF Transcript_26246/g.38902 Transcript_26246/m.38902 type:complete len:341 (+) Transcript_26246:63-1085(+)|eukprot:CAMPEP_0185041896 /NCGR_PEP_ID=MMETSP1103-20130426/41756_1 /TAXON_ID=36769 /ORGANISM="Paraphysomonas bandaiensis, Strain Caron Lab Isolate" /LENGTH=340 /DNA_ID=CAMNT_0027581829 /DNA_START=1 /DNA_END=1023 /DNA_ORIENTATION=+